MYVGTTRVLGAAMMKDFNGVHLAKTMYRLRAWRFTGQVSIHGLSTWGGVLPYAHTSQMRLGIGIGVP